jgi:hypothetical protein
MELSPDAAQPNKAATQSSSLTKKSREEILAEIRGLSDKADKAAQSRQNELFDDLKLDEGVDGLTTSFLKDVADPDASHRLYFGMRNMMVRNLPKGPENKTLRQHIYDEVNLYLNRGKQKDARGIRGSSGQMTYIPTFLEPAFDIVLRWVGAGANPFELYSAFEAKNTEMGYRAGDGDGEGAGSKDGLPTPPPSDASASAGIPAPSLN